MFIIYDKYLNNKLRARKYLRVLFKTLFGELDTSHSV